MNRPLTSIAAALVAAFLLAACCGCGPKRPETAPVAGRVTFLGKPVPAGRITFHPDQGRPAIGDIGPDGRYSLTTFVGGDGALLGRHRVTIEAVRQTGPPPPKSFADEIHGLGGGGVEWLVPRDYARLETSSLTAEVKRGENAVNFDLPAKP